jgi:ferrous iron transport protein B
MSIALLGNPNTGKTSLFNYLTGSYEYVGNWSGVTVEKKVGQLKNTKGQIIDLPGVYTLNPLSRDEGVVTEFFLEETCNKILNIIDASQLERNLHLTMQILEYGKPVVIGVNMVDVAINRGLTINAKKLSGLLKVPVAPITARNGKGCDHLADLLAKKDNPFPDSYVIDYGPEVDEAVIELKEELGYSDLSERWLCLQLLEGNQNVKNYLGARLPMQWVEDFIVRNDQKINAAGKAANMETYVYQVRQKEIRNIVDEVIDRPTEQPITFTERVDTIVTNKYLGMPIFFGIMPDVYADV